jgi:tRNA threonylcarbamoyladenosine biosynthesis protein TsaB
MTDPRMQDMTGSDYTLALDASTYRGTVAVLRGTRVLAEREVAMKGADEERLMPAVADVLAEVEGGVASLARVVCGQGPGSFTSLRIAGAIAKGIASARSIPLFAVSSLYLIAAAASPPLDEGAWLCVADAMRGECYATDVYVSDHGVLVHETSDRLVHPADFGAERAHQKRIVGPNVAGVDRESWPHARGVARDLAWILSHPPVDLERWEPSYGRLAEAQVKWEAAHGRPLSRA